MTAAIESVGLTKRFPKCAGYRQLVPWARREEVTALDAVTLEVAEGEVFGLLGPNGAGKTTLVKTLCSLVLPSAGRAAVFGHDVVSRDADVRRLVGLVSADERSFYWRLTGRQNLEFFAALYSLGGAAGRQRVDDLLELLGLTDSADRRFQTYSTGMRQKMAIARGLLPSPRVLFVDEPTRSLDPLAARTVREFLRQEVVRLGCTVVIATHQMAEAEWLCDRVAILAGGRVLACGSVAELRLAQRRDLCVLEVGGLDLQNLSHLEAVTGVTSVRMEKKVEGTVGLEVGLRDSRTHLSGVIESLVTAGGRILSCAVRERSLEEVFIDVVGGASPAAGDARSRDPDDRELVTAC